MDALTIAELDTPCLTVDLDVFESNVRLCLDRLGGVCVRPHLKTAKSPGVARLLLNAGATGICVAKLSEAEVMLGGYSGVPRHSVSILEGIRQRLGPGATVTHAEGVRITEDSAFTRDPQPLVGGTRSQARWSADRVVPADPDANLMIRAGTLALRRIAGQVRVPFVADPQPDDPITISRDEFDEAWHRLALAGVPLRDDREAAWRSFAGWRVNYDIVLLNLARLTESPPAPWVSDRSPLDVESNVTLFGHRRFARVHPDSHSDRSVGERLAGRCCRRQRVGGPRKRHKE